MGTIYKVESVMNDVVEQAVTFKTLAEAKALGKQWLSYNHAVDFMNRRRVVITKIVNGFDIYSLTRSVHSLRRHWKKENLTNLVDINIKWPV